MEIKQIEDSFKDIRDYDGLVGFINGNNFSRKDSTKVEVLDPSSMSIDVYEIFTPKGIIAVHYMEKMSREASGKSVVYQKKAMLSLNYVSLGSIILE